MDDTLECVILFVFNRDAGFGCIETQTASWNSQQVEGLRASRTKLV
jgi:hypothetical protein